MAVMTLLITFLLLVVPAAAGILLIVLSRRGGLGYPSCGASQYNLSAIVGAVDRCPECGALFVEAGIQPPRGKRKPVLLWSGIALLLLPLTCFGFFTYQASQSAIRARAMAVQAQQQAAAAAQNAPPPQQASDSEPGATPQAESE